jgi:hypothetical protein
MKQLSLSTLCIIMSYHSLVTLNIKHLQKSEKEKK